MWIAFPGIVHLILSFWFMSNVVAFESSTKFPFSTSNDLKVTKKMFLLKVSHSIRLMHILTHSSWTFSTSSSLGSFPKAAICLKADVSKFTDISFHSAMQLPNNKKVLFFVGVTMVTCGEDHNVSWLYTGTASLNRALKQLSCIVGDLQLIELGSVHTYPEIFISAIFFYADTPSVHTCPTYTLGVSGDFCIRSPALNFCIRCVSGYVWTLVSLYFCIRWRHSIRTCSLILWDVRIRIGYVWTVVYDSYTLRVDADIFFRIRVDGALFF